MEGVRLSRKLMFTTDAYDQTVEVTAYLFGIKYLSFLNNDRVNTNLPSVLV